MKRADQSPIVDEWVIPFVLGMILFVLLLLGLAIGLRVADAATPAAEELQLEIGPELAEAVHAVAFGTADQVLLLGTRGEGKTIGALIAMIAHAEQHRAAGFRLPTVWLGVRDTFLSHERNTHQSLTDPLWRGCWRLSKGGSVAEFRLQGRALVRLMLMGVNSPGDEDALRTQCHGVWFEEPAAAVNISSGISERAWEIALTSRGARMPTHAKAGLITANYPEEDHWIALRFVQHPRPGTAWVVLPRGTRTTEADRAAWAAAISDPVLRGRLIEGRFGTVLLGEAVAVGYNAQTHIAPAPLPVLRGDLWFGWDSALNARTHATVIGQRLGPAVRVYASLVTGDAWIKQHVERAVLPWLEAHAPWTLEAGGDDRLYHRYDPAMDTGESEDIDQSPLLRVQRELGGHFAPGAVPWPARIGPVLRLFDAAPAGVSALQIDPGEDTEVLRKALAGRWDYAKNAAGTVARDLPRKPNHPWEDVGDALCYLIGGLAPSRDLAPPTPRAPRRYTRILGRLG